MFDGVTDAELLHFFVFFENCVRVFPELIGLFGNWGPLEWRGVRVVSLLAFVKEFIEEMVHGGCNSWITGLAGKIVLVAIVRNDYMSSTGYT